MEKVIVNFGENKVSAGEGFSGNGTSASPLGFTGDIQHTDKRTLLWETTGTPYNTTIQLNEPITHYNEIMIYGSGVETEAGGYHTSKNVYQTQPRPINAGPWAFSLWNLASYRCAYTLGADMILSGNSGYIGSSFANGIPQGSTAFAGFKWTGADANKMLMPWRIYGIGKKRVNTLTIINGDHGTVSASVLTGCEYDTVTLSNTPDEDWYFSGYNITGATLTGNKFTFGNSDVTVEGVWSDQPQIKTLTLQTDGHGTLTANKVTGYEGDTVTLTPTYNTYYRFNNYSVTGGTVNGNTYTFGTATNQTAKANFKVNSFTATGTFNWSDWTLNAGLTANKSYNAILKAFTGSKPSNWPATNGNWNVTNASAYGINASTKVRTKKSTAGNTWASCSARILIAGSTKAGMSSAAVYVSANAGTYKDVLTLNLSKNTTQGQLAYSGHFQIDSYGSSNTFTWNMSTNGWTATGYAP